MFFDFVKASLESEYGAERNFLCGNTNQADWY